MFNFTYFIDSHGEISDTPVKEPFFLGAGATWVSASCPRTFWCEQEETWSPVGRHTVKTKPTDIHSQPNVNAVFIYLLMPR